MNNAQLIIETEKLSRTKTSHIFHLFMSIISVGMWLPIWIICAIGNTSERKSIEKRLKELDE